ncbi:HTH-type transcriptional regulator ygiT [Escherichia coli]|uniref:HTH-type transcriptional regulator ygiT n=1 Tax=Escherichia coli TaxID=562 RepID=A0A2X1JZJ7_ECOLX|nr:putative DNA-binding transcriptional regulator [Escherichia coli O32:H37 str. P4]SPW45882.1 HTH-type transcriptional regulator ygiT [Escherichia coli]
MKCPVCHQGEMVSGIKDIPYTFRGRKTVLKGIHGLYCVHCEESIMNKEESDAFMAQVKAFRASVNAETVAPEFIVKVRKKALSYPKRGKRNFWGRCKCVFALRKRQCPTSSFHNQTFTCSG